MTLIALNKLHPDPRNANVCPPDVLDKLKSHIQRTELCPMLLVRPHPQLEGEYMIIDGHHRKLVIESLGWSRVACQVKAMSDEEAGLLLLTLNRLRGVDSPRKRAELMDALLPTWSVRELAVLLPETSGEIEGLLALLKQDQEALEAAYKEQLQAEKSVLPVPFGFMVSAEDAPLVQEALAKYQDHTVKDQGQAWVEICRRVLSDG
jgi:ParB-like chromosome segregation protein Spo0J